LAALSLLVGLGAGALQAQTQPGGADTKRLERSWNALDAQLRALDALIPAENEPSPSAITPAPPLPPGLLAPNAAARGPLAPGQGVAPPPLALPQPSQLQQGVVQGLSLNQALVLGFANNAELQAQRQQVAAALDELQAALGTYWPRILTLANGNTGQSSISANTPLANDTWGVGPQFAPNSLMGANGQPVNGAFYSPAGGLYYQNNSVTTGSASLQLDYALLDFARTPAVQAARARLRQERNRYANQLRQLQLQISEAYYQLQQADQTVRIFDAAVRNDLLILRDALDLKQAGLVPRLDVMRRRAIEASDQESLIQALADRAIARRQLATVLNLAPEVTPSASDPISPMPRWPLNLEESLLSAYRGNPELEAILATREALARQRDATAATLLPKLSLFANGSGYGTNLNTFDVNTSYGGCCPISVSPVVNSNGYDWSMGLTLRWLLFDAGTTAGQAQALAKRASATAQQYASQRNAIRLRLETAFFNHEASLAKLSSARRGVAAALEAFRDVRLRYQTGLSSEVDLSITQERLITSLLQRLNATVGVNVSYARLLRELLPVPRDPAAPLTPQLTVPGPVAAGGPGRSGAGAAPANPPATAPTPAPGQRPR
jgi:outer membrane protein TolC